MATHEIQVTQTFHVFYSRIVNSTYIFADGVSAAFVSGRFTTADEDRAAALKKEIATGNPYLFQDPDKLKLTEAELDPMAELKARIIAEYEMGKASETTNDMGSSEQGKLTVADSSVIQKLAANSLSAAVAVVK